MRIARIIRVMRFSALVPTSLSKPIRQFFPSAQVRIADRDLADQVNSTRLSGLERLPTWAICIPLAVQWLWLALRFRSLTLPSVANPAIVAGGLVGEGKMEIFCSMGPLARASTATFCGIINRQDLAMHEVMAALDEAGLSFPLIAKPDLGLCGHGVQKITTIAELMKYFAVFPRNETAVLQTYLAAEEEAGIFYVRHPGCPDGYLLGMALRYYPRVIGDGRRCIGELIAADPRAQRVLSSAHALSVDLECIPPAGERVRLATIGSTRVGSLYRDATHLITQALVLTFDAIAKDIPHFHFGRFDVRFTSLDELAAGRGFSIMEVNGASSEAIHAWDPVLGYRGAFRIIFHKQNILFEVAAAQRRASHRPIGIRSLIRLYRHQRNLISRYPPSR